LGEVEWALPSQVDPMQEMAAFCAGLSPDRAGKPLLIWDN